MRKRECDLPLLWFFLVKKFLLMFYFSFPFFPFLFLSIFCLCLNEFNASFYLLLFTIKCCNLIVKAYQ